MKKEIMNKEQALILLGSFVMSTKERMDHFESNEDRMAVVELIVALEIAMEELKKSLSGATE